MSAAANGRRAAPVMQRPIARSLAVPLRGTRSGASAERRSIAVKRACDASSVDDGMRVLIDRQWPPGLSKEQAAIDLWLQDVAPSDALRRWYGRDRAAGRPSARSTAPSSCNAPTCCACSTGCTEAVR